MSTRGTETERERARERKTERARERGRMGEIGRTCPMLVFVVAATA